MAGSLLRHRAERSEAPRDARSAAQYLKPGDARSAAQSLEPVDARSAAKGLG